MIYHVNRTGDDSDGIDSLEDPSVGTAASPKVAGASALKEEASILSLVYIPRGTRKCKSLKRDRMVSQLVLLSLNRTTVHGNERQFHAELIY